jgi:hypothetical protein
MIVGILVLALAAFAAASLSAPLAVYDLRYAYQNLSVVAGYEEVQLLAALAGLVNRAGPALYLNLEPVDSLWLSLAFTATPPGAPWLAGATITNVSAPAESLLALFPTAYRGVVLYDPSVCATSAIANTAAGAEDLLPVAYRPDDPTSLYARLVAGGPRLTVQRNLVGLFNGSITGSIKRDSYTWAVDTFLKTNLSDGAHLHYYVDYWWTRDAGNSGGGGWEKATLPNLDYGVAKRGFFFDLSVWTDEAPVDEPGQPLGADAAAFRYILAAAYESTGGESMITVHGFTPWAYKYVAPNGKHAGVETEWATVVIASAYNVLVDADACCIGNMANAALWAHFPLADRYIQPPPPTPAQLRARGLLDADGRVPGNRLYYLLYAGDFDSGAWVYSQLFPRWTDPARGSVPITWGVDPGIAARFGPIWPLLFAGASGNDTIITGDSGAGYINPTMLYGLQRALESGLPDGLQPWVELNVALNRQFGISWTGFAISGDAPQPTAFDEDVYFNMSAAGVVEQGWPGRVAHLQGNLPVVMQTDLSSDATAAAATVATYVNAGQAEPTFAMFRSVLTSPSFFASVAAGATIASEGAAVPVLPLEMSAIMRVVLNGSNDNRCTYAADTLPGEGGSVPCGSGLVTFNVTVRNDGWNVLDAAHHGLLVSTPSSQVLARLAVGEGRAGWAGAGRVALDAGAGVVQGVRRELARRGFVGERSGSVAGSPSLFMLPADLPVGGSVTVRASFPAPSCGTVPQLLTITYQLTEVDDSGAPSRAFSSYGSLPWVASVLISPPA